MRSTVSERLFAWGVEGFVTTEDRDDIWSDFHALHYHCASTFQLLVFSRVSKSVQLDVVELLKQVLQWTPLYKPGLNKALLQAAKVGSAGCVKVNRVVFSISTEKIKRHEARGCQRQTACSSTFGKTHWMCLDHV